VGSQRLTSCTMAWPGIPATPYEYHVLKSLW
jgi:hypothetical protein